MCVRARRDKGAAQGAAGLLQGSRWTQGGGKLDSRVFGESDKSDKISLELKLC